jgi:hypothetical protein
MTGMRRCAVLLAIALVPATRVGAQDDVRAQLLARGAPTAFADRVAQIVGAAAAEDLPIEPIVTKALEGWAKHARVPPDRVVTVLERLAVQLRTGRDVTVAAGVDPAPAVVAAAAEALGRGVPAADVQAVMRAAPSAEGAATGLTVAASLTAQGLGTDAATKAVRDAYMAGRPASDILEFPSVVAGLVAGGVPMSDVARRILEEGGLPLPSEPGRGLGRGRPSGIPAGRGPPDEPPGKGKGKGPPTEPPGKGKPSAP